MTKKSVKSLTKGQSSYGRKKKIIRKNKNRIIYAKPILGLEHYFKQNKQKTKSLKKSSQTENYSPRFISFWEKHPRATTFFLATATTAGFLTYFIILKDLPHPRQLTETKPPMTTIIRDRKGRVLYRVYREANRTQLSFNEIPDLVKKSTIAIEDANFYHHWGVDFKAVTRAFLNNIKQEDSDYFQGGSTITQQLVKNRFFTSEKSYLRKSKEAVEAVWTELIYSKEDILTMYLNTVGYGGPAYGIEAASQMYFNKSAKDLNLAQAAYLAGLPAAPTTFSPYGTNPQLATLRQQQVLERMLKLKFINEAEYLTAVNETVALAPQKINILAPHFVMYVKEELVKRFGEKAVEEGGFDVTTTLDLDIHNQVQEIVFNNIESIRNTYRINNGAVLVTDPKKGEILSMVGSVDYFDADNSGHYNATLAKRQPGSSIKPINYAFAFDHGFTPTSTILDAPVIYRSPGSTEVYAPVNYDGKFHGNVTLRSALANSYNIPAVKVLEKIGVENMIQQGINMGIKSWKNLSQIGLSLTLGGAEVTMLDMARAYGTIDNLGISRDLKSILSIKDVNTKDLTAEFYNNSNINLAPIVKAQDDSEEIVENNQDQPVISPLSAYWLTDIMSDNVARLPAFGSYAKLTVPNHKVAVKTGTSNNFRDNWTIGYTPDYLVAAWVGNNDGSFMNKNLVSGITGAAPIWNEVMAYLLTDKEPKEFPVPDGLIAVKVCAVNGLLTCPNCPQEKTEYFTADKLPTKQCFFRSKGECDTLKTQAEAEHKTDEEKKALLSGCALTN